MRSILDEQDSLGPDGVELASVRGMDLRVAPGETVALVSPSGSGTTTLMALLQRLYDPLSVR